MLEVLVLGLVALVAGELPDRTSVPLVEEEALAVGEGLIDELVEEIRPDRRDPALVDFVEALEDAAPEGMRPAVEPT